MGDSAVEGNALGKKVFPVAEALDASGWTAACGRCVWDSGPPLVLACVLEELQSAKGDAQSGAAVLLKLLDETLLDDEGFLAELKEPSDKPSEIFKLIQRALENGAGVRCPNCVFSPADGEGGAGVDAAASDAHTCRFCEEHHDIDARELVDSPALLALLWARRLTSKKEEDARTSGAMKPGKYMTQIATIYEKGSGVGPVAAGPSTRPPLPAAHLHVHAGPSALPAPPYSEGASNPIDRRGEKESPDRQAPPRPRKAAGVDPNNILDESLKRERRKTEQLKTDDAAARTTPRRKGNDSKRPREAGEAEEAGRSASESEEQKGKKTKTKTTAQEKKGKGAAGGNSAAGGPGEADALDEQEQQQQQEEEEEVVVNDDDVNAPELGNDASLDDGEEGKKIRKDMLKSEHMHTVLRRAYVEPDPAAPFASSSSGAKSKKRSKKNDAGEENEPAQLALKQCEEDLGKGEDPFDIGERVTGPILEALKRVFIKAEDRRTRAGFVLSAAMLHHIESTVGGAKRSFDRRKSLRGKGKEHLQWPSVGVAVEEKFGPALRAAHFPVDQRTYKVMMCVAALIREYPDYTKVVGTVRALELFRYLAVVAQATETQLRTLQKALGDGMPAGLFPKPLEAD
eukprot:tig00021583_g22650.t2